MIKVKLSCPLDPCSNDAHLNMNSQIIKLKVLTQLQSKLNDLVI